MSKKVEEVVRLVRGLDNCPQCGELRAKLEKLIGEPVRVMAEESEEVPAKESGGKEIPPMVFGGGEVINFAKNSYAKQSDTQAARDILKTLRSSTGNLTANQLATKIKSSYQTVICVLNRLKNNGRILSKKERYVDASGRTISGYTWSALRENGALHG